MRPHGCVCRALFFIGVCLLPAVLAPSPALASGTVVSWGPNRLDFFVTGEDGHVWHMSFNGTAWQAAWDDRGYASDGIQGEIKAVSWGVNRLDLFAIDDGHVWHTAWNGSSWQPWDNRGSPPADSMTAVARSPDLLDLFVTSNGHLWYQAWNGSTWLPWKDLGTAPSVQVRGPITAVSWSTNRLDVFVEGADLSVWHTGWNGSGWQAPMDSRGAPPNGMDLLGAVSWAPNRIDLFTLSPTSLGAYPKQLWHDSWSGSSWEPAWDARGCPPAGIAQALAAVSWGQNRLDVFAQGAEQGFHIWHTAWNGSSWQEWDELAPSPEGAYDVWAVSWGANRLDVFTIGASTGHLLHSAWNGSSWQPWDDLGVPPPRISD